MHRITEELGRHDGLPGRALSKYEVSAALCRAGSIGGGHWAIPEYEFVCDGATRKVDVVWATRSRPASQSLWTPVAAFEIEGHDVGGSIAKDAESLAAAANAGAKVCAIVLFQTGPNGLHWHRPLVRSSVAQVEQKLKESLGLIGSTCPIEVVLDEHLAERLETWLQRISSPSQSQRAGGT